MRGEPTPNAPDSQSASARLQRTLHMSTCPLDSAPSLQQAPAFILLYCMCRLWGGHVLCADVRCCRIIYEQLSAPACQRVGQLVAAVSLCVGCEVGMYPALMRAIAGLERQPDVIVTDIVTLVSEGQPRL
jgi:hypothetical protein